MNRFASPGRTRTFARPFFATRSAARRAYFFASSMPRKFRSGWAVAALARKRPLPEPISTSTGWSLPNRSGHETGAGRAAGSSVKGVASIMGGAEVWPGRSRRDFVLVLAREGDADDPAVEDHV